MVMFDLPPPLQCKGIEAYEGTWDLLFRYHKIGTAFNIQETRRDPGPGRRFRRRDHALRSRLIKQPGGFCVSKSTRYPPIPLSDDLIGLHLLDEQL
jgi:hypothetical protein